MASFDEARVRQVDALKQRAAERDARMAAVHLVRTGQSHVLFGDLFPADWPRPVIANTIDVIAQDVSEQVGVLPTFTAAGDSIIEESGRRRADKLTKIINFYVWSSRLGVRLPQAADRFVTYGFLPVRVEANHEGQRPHIHFDDPVGAYFDRDRWGTVTNYCKVFTRLSSEIAALFPEHEGYFLPTTRMGQANDPMVELALSYDADGSYLTVMAGEHRGLVLSAAGNALGRIPVAIAERPTLDNQNRGAFDDVLWVFAARAKLALLALEATQKAVESPIAVPDDVQEINLGPDSIIRTNNPQGIGRVRMDLPQAAFAENAMLDNEIKFGARFPEARAGQSDASVVTGKGVQALMSGFDARVKTHQSILGEAINDALSMALELDEKVWGGTDKEINSVANGTPYVLKYKPARDIKGSYAVNYEYGVMAGLDPNKALVWGLQGLGAGLFSRSFMRRNLPIGLDVQEEERIIDIERLRDTALSAAAAYAQAIPQMAASGQDPSQPLKVISSLIEARKTGTPIEVALTAAFAPETPTGQADPAAGAAMPQDPMSGLQQPAPGGVDIPAQQAPPPSMAQLLSQLGTSGRSEMSARTVRQTRL
jgi:hypothetical protein